MSVILRAWRPWKTKKSATGLLKIRSKYRLCAGNELYCCLPSFSFFRRNRILDFRGINRRLRAERHLWAKSTWPLQALLCDLKSSKINISLALWSLSGAWHHCGDVCIGLGFLSIFKYHPYRNLLRISWQLSHSGMALFLWPLPRTFKIFQA